MNNIYIELIKTREKAELKFAESLKKHLRASSTHKGDLENELEEFQDKIAFYNEQMRDYESKHPEEFEDIVEKAVVSQKMVRQSERKNDTVLHELRPTELTQQILNIMITNTFIHLIEQTLSSNKTYWREAKINIPKAGSDSYTFWYFYFQADGYKEVIQDLMKINLANFKYDLDKLLSKLEKRSELLGIIIPADRKVAAHRRLITLERFMSQTRYEIITCPNTEAHFMKLKLALKGYLEELIIGLIEVSKAALNFMDKGGKIETERQVI
jgi:hypothetical protein